MNPLQTVSADMAGEVADVIGKHYKHITVTYMERAAYISAQNGNDWLNVRIFEGDSFEERVSCFLGTYQIKDDEPVNPKGLLINGSFEELREALYRFLGEGQAA